jgi:hypothetical protein
MKTTSRILTFALASALAACSSSDSSGPAKSGAPVGLSVVSGSAQEGATGEALTAPLSVKVVDKNGNGVAKALVTFSVTAGGGTLSATLDTTDANGVASTTWTLGQALGDGRVEARVQGILAPAVFTATAKAGAPATLERISANVGTAAASFDLPDSVAVKVSDKFGHPVSGISVAFAVTAGGGKVSPASRATGDDGVARAAWTMGATGTQTLTATTPGATTAINGVATACPEVSLAVGQMMTVQPGSAQCLITTGAAQHYLVTVVNPTNAPTTTSAFRVRGAGSSIAETVEPPVASLRTGFAAITSAEARAELDGSHAESRAHARALQANYDVMQRLGTVSTGSRRSASIVASAAAAPPAVGDLIAVQIPKNFNNLCDNTNSTNPDLGSAKVTGRVVFVGTHSVILEDQSDPLNGKFDTLYVKVGQEFDNTMWPILTTNFGNPLAMDAQLNGANAIGKVFMMFSHNINAMQQGQLAGFVSSTDFYTPSVCPTSNLRPTFYARVPTSTNTGFDADNTTQTPEEWYRGIQTVIIHETKHVTSFAEKFVRNSGQFPGNGFGSRDQWLEESSAMLSEELWDRGVFGYTQNSNVNYAQSIYCEVRPTPNSRWPQCQPTKPTSMIDHFFYLYDYAQNPEGLSIVGPVASGDFTFYGVGWMFLRWVIDNYSASESNFLTQMTDQVQFAGTDEIEQRAGKPIADLLAEFSVALALDDYPNFTPANPKLKIPSWNTRDIFAQLSADFASQGVFTTPTPINLRPAGFGKFLIDVGAVHGGGMSFVDVNGTQSAKQLFEFKGASGSDFPSEMRISIVRVQ